VKQNPRAAASGSALFFGLIIEDYPRNRRLREFLGHEFLMESIVLPVDDEPGYARKGAGLLRLALRSPRGTYRLVVVPEFALKYAPLAWLVARYHRAPLLVDWFVGLYETRIGDWGQKPGLRAKVGLILDKAAVRLAGILVTDTQVRAEMLRHEYGAYGSAIALPVGAPDWARPRDRPKTDSLQILYYGSYQPLHGLDAFVEALANVVDKTRISLTLIGAGNTRPAVENSLVRLGLYEHCTFIDAVPEAELGVHIAKADVVLGIFGDSKKASSVIANKVWQGLACNRVVLTRSNPALAELRDMAGPLLVEVESVDDTTAHIEHWLDDLSVLRSTTVPDIDLHLETYVRDQYQLLQRELRRSGL
jgi:glycosyltransferase involved in cell wall biosynthesis